MLCHHVVDLYFPDGNDIDHAHLLISHLLSSLENIYPDLLPILIGLFPL